MPTLFERARAIRESTIVKKMRGMPDLLMSEGGSRIEVFTTRVGNGSEFRGVFKPGENVADIRVIGTNPREAVGLMKAFQAKMVPELRRRGVVGAFGDTPNKAFEKFSRKTQATVTDAPTLKSMAVKAWYAWKVASAGFPRSMLSNPVKRVAFRFD